MAENEHLYSAYFSTMLSSFVRAAGRALSCGLPSLMDQHKDEATIQDLETLWNMTMAKGDTNFERCLLTSNFMEILPSGKLKTATDQLGFIAKNKRQNKPIPDLPRITVLMRPNVAVAYAAGPSTSANRKRDQTAGLSSGKMVSGTSSSPERHQSRTVATKVVVAGRP